MKDLFIKLTKQAGRGIQSIGFELVWDSPNLVYEDVYESLGVFETVNCALKSGQNNRIAFGAANLENELTEDSEIAKISFAFINDREMDVNFNVENLTAQDAQGQDIEMTINVANYTVEIGRWVLEMIWR